MKRSKVLVIGIDGATFDLIKPWIKQERLPLFKKLMKEGCYGGLESTIPPLSPSAWTSAFTGVNPGKHGIFDFRVWNGYQQEPAFSTDIKVPTVWERIGKDQLRSVVINVPLTYPPQKIEGVMITGMQTPGLKSEFTYPKSLRQKLEREGYVIDYADVGPVVPQKKDWLQKSQAIIEKRGKIALELLQKENWDLFIVVFTVLDRVQHFFWDETEKIFKIYQTIEKTIEKILSNVDENTYVIIFSDHGFGFLSYDVYLNNFLNQLGLLTLKPRYSVLEKIGFTQKNILNIAGLLTKLGLKRLVDFVSVNIGTQIGNMTTTQNISWLKTKAWFSSLSAQSIRINLIGREPLGIVKPTDYDMLRNFIIKKVAGLRDPRSGRKIVNRAYKKEEIYWGPYLKDAPDIVLSAKEGYVFQGGFSRKLIMPARQGRARRLADHRPRGIFLITGPKVKRGIELKNLRIWDVAPTILYLLGYRNHSGLDGKRPKKAFIR